MKAMKSKNKLCVAVTLWMAIVYGLLSETAHGKNGVGIVTAPPDYQYQTSIGYSKDLDYYEGFSGYSFPAGKNSNHVAGIGIASNNHVYTWFKDGTVSEGTRKDLDAYEAPVQYSIPAGKSYNTIIGVAIAGSNNHVFAWYADGTVSSGTSKDFSYYYDPKPCVPATGKKVTDLVGVGIASNNHVYYWYKDGTVSSGTTVDWDLYSTPVAYTLPASKTPGDIAAMAIASTNDRSFTWYHGRAIGQAYQPVEEYIDQIVLELIDSTDIPGLTVAASKEGRMVFSKGYGLSNYETKRSMHPEHASWIGSTSKIFTTLGLMKLTEEKRNFDVTKKVYGAGGALTDPIYQTDILKGIRRRRPIVGMDMTKATDRVFTWYVNGQVTSGTPDDLDKFTGPTNYTLPPGQTPDNIVGIAIAKFNDHVYVWYEDGSLSSGISTDLDYYFYKPVTIVNDKPVAAYKSPYGVNRILGIAISNVDKVYVWYENGKVSQGSPIDFEAYEKAKPFTDAAGKSRYDIRDFAIAGTNNHVYAWYSDGKVSSGTSTDLDYYTSPVNYTVPPALHDFGVQEWKNYYDKMEIRHLLSHTAGFTRSGDVAAAATMFNKKDTDLTYAEAHRYILRMHKLKFEPGTSDSYSNHGMGLTGHILATNSGVAYEDYVTNKILKPMQLNRVVPYPLGTNDQYYAAAHTNSKGIIKVITKAGSGGSIGEDEEVDEESIVGLGYAAGGWAASAQDLVRMMLGTDQRIKHSDILSPATLDLMESRPFPETASGRAHGWAIKCTTNCNSKKLAHDGRLDGGNSYIAKFAEGYILNKINVGNINIAVCSNIGTGHTNEFRVLVDRIAEKLGQTTIPLSYDLIYTDPLNNPDDISQSNMLAKDEASDENASINTWSIYPVPSPGISTVSFQLAQQSAVSLEIYNWNGVKVQTVLNQQSLPSGKHDYAIGSYSLPKGLYIVHLRVNNRLETRNILIN
jgi:CubicO group peptidase (beta-lactamase class C family)